MSYREVSMVEIREVFRLRASGHGLKSIVRLVGLSRNTVRRYLDAADAAGVVVPADGLLDDEALAVVVASIQSRRGNVGAARLACRERREQIAAWARECDAPKICRLLEREGVLVPLRTLQRFMKEELGAKRDTVRLRDPKPGILEFDFMTLGTFADWAGKAIKVHAAVMTASVSRHQFVWPCLTQTRDDVIDALEAAWGFFGGVFPVVLPDNLKAVVAEADAVNPRFNPWFLEYAQARGFEIEPARIRKPKDKAKVERQVRYVRKDFFGGESFRSLEEVRAAAVRWCRDVAGLREHNTTHRQPADHFLETDALVLEPEPETSYDTPIWTEHTVGRDHAVTVQKALYSVPYEVVGKVRVRTDRTTVKIYQRRQIVKVHPRVPTGEKQLDPRDAPPGRADVVDRTATSLFERADEHSGIIGVYARKLAPDPELRIADIRKVWRLLSACQTYGPSAVGEACSRALELDVIDVKRIEGMLEKGLERREVVTVRAPRRQGKVYTFERPPSAFAMQREDP